MKNIIFSSNEDYIYGMNAIAICKIQYIDVKILAFCLMNNHVHFILDCEKDDGLLFMKHYKLLIGKSLKNKYGMERNLNASKCTSGVWATAASVLLKPPGLVMVASAAFI